MPDAESPRRTCIGCRRVRSQTDLVRIALDAGGRPHVGFRGGRGAWLCGAQCLGEAVRRQAFSRAWRRPIDAATLAAVEALVTRAMQDEARPGTLSGGVTNERRLTTTRKG